jgi:hypothetical protein
MCVVKYACASVLLLSVIKFTRKLPNIPTNDRLGWFLVFKTNVFVSEENFFILKHGVEKLEMIPILLG